MITIREATGRDVPAIRETFLACYGTYYTDPRLYNELQLTRLVYSDSTLVLVAEDDETGRIAGTASVDLEVGAYADLVGEFGRLAVHPNYRRHGVARQLLAERLERVRDRLQVGLIEARLDPPYSLRNAEAHGFAVVGFLPMSWLLQRRESLSLLACYFGDTLGLRKNHPRVIPEVHPLAHLALENCGLGPDAVVDEDATAYPPGGSFEFEELTADGYAALLRIQRGRVRHREVFGPARLHYGLFKLQARRSRYLIAREGGRIAGAVGFTHDPLGDSVRIFELIALRDEVIRPMLGELVGVCREQWGVGYLEIDVSAYEPRIQRTLVELGFLPVAYIPALVFHEVERLDAVKMSYLMTTPDVAIDHLTPRAKTMADAVLRQFRSREVEPWIAQAVRGLPLFGGLNAEQFHRLAGACRLMSFEPGQALFRQDQDGQEMHVVLQGEVAIAMADPHTVVGVVHAGECLGEMSLLTAAAHSATATALTRVETAALSHQDLAELIRLRPDIGLHFFRNVAVGMGEKLKRLDAALARR
jgi:GNAT superfamily N-acetyltransferase